MSAGHYRLDNLIAVIDYNKVMAKGFVSEEMTQEPIADRWKSFGWNIIEVDGHDVTDLQKAFYRAKYIEMRGKPICIIAHTVKGRGIEECEFNYKWHTHAPSINKAEEFLKELAVRYLKPYEGIRRLPAKSDDGESGCSDRRRRAMKFYQKNLREVFGETLVELGEKYNNVIVMDADLNTSTRTSLFRDRFPQRFIQCGIAEANMFGIAAGLAHMGYVPFPSTFAAFAARKSLDQVYMNICCQKLNVKIPGSYAGMTATECGPSHNAGEDLAVMRAMPFMRVVDPGDNNELRSVMYKMMEYDGPVYFRVPKVEAPVLFDDGYQFEWGKGVVMRDGEDITLMGTGMMTGICLKAAELLQSEDISAEVIHMPSIKPIDEELIVRTAKKTGCMLSLENGRIIGGFGSAVSEVLAKEYPILLDMMGNRGYDNQKRSAE